MANDFSGKIAIVTGGTGGLGKEIARALGEAGALVIIGSNNRAGLDSIKKEFGEAGISCDALFVDVAEGPSVENFVNQVIGKYGRIDILVNNAGWATKKSNVEDTSTETYRKYMAVNADSVFFFTKEVVHLMRKQKSGIIVNISSGAGKRGHPGLAAYSAAKFAVMGITQAAARELEGSGVKVVAVCPAGINTKMRREIFGEEDAARQQSPEAVAKIIRDVIAGEIDMPNGGDIFIKDGRIA